MKLLRKFLSLTHSDRHLLVSAVFLLGAIRLGLWLLPFPTWRRLLVSRTETTPELKAAEPASQNRVVWAVKVASRYIPGVKCLALALATKVLLAHQGYISELRIGVVKSKSGQLEAHAWVESQGKIVIGGARDLSYYTPLPLLEGGRL